MTINILCKGIVAHEPIYHAACMECWTTFTYEQEDIKRVPGIVECGNLEIVICPICKHDVFVNDKMPYVPAI